MFICLKGESLLHGKVSVILSWGSSDASLSQETSNLLWALNRPGRVVDYLVLWLGQKVSGNSWILARTEFFCNSVAKARHLCLPLWYHLGQIQNALFNPPQNVSCIFRITDIKLFLCRPSGIFTAPEHKDTYLREVGPKYLLSFPKEDLCLVGWF